MKVYINERTVEEIPELNARIITVNYNKRMAVDAQTWHRNHYTFLAKLPDGNTIKRKYKRDMVDG